MAAAAAAAATAAAAAATTTTTTTTTATTAKGNEHMDFSAFAIAATAVSGANPGRHRLG